ncbi:helix-turn-helix transcriptional regulator [Evansella sp. LMS18]|uniref:helix-turn-helix transcriptional regulator n=1 Tax=Evansella sp. LMS18 TaxID=2924033 RepID=UPI0020D09E07|nr:helix-turn-helix transcriptional regulator [Evansella sp. LMS18]UTR09368.1 helix-turn-helix transcriptional regulator [Evansella sp. LMS18]
MELNNRQETILQIVKDNGPITGDKIAERLSLTRATLRPDLAILTMAGYLDARPRVGYFYTGKTGSQLLTERIKKLTVKDFQSMPVVVNESASVYDAIVNMFLEDVGTLFVVDGQSSLTGILSRKDLLRASMGKQDLESVPVSIIMTRMPNITSCSPDDLLIDVATKLISKQIDSVPVVKEVKKDGIQKLEVVGRITKTNITKAFVSIANDEIQ